MVDIKSSSNAVWWIKMPKELERRTQSLGTKLCQDMRDLFRNISLHGYNNFFDSKLLIYEKLIWLCPLLTALAASMTLLSYTWDQFVLQSFVVNLHDPLYRIENIPFPAVSICSNNRISRQAAEKYAYELSLKDPLKRSDEYFLTRIKYLNSLYYKFERSDDLDEYDIFQTYLDIYGTDANDTNIDMLKIMRRLTPNCTDLIVKCKLGGKFIDCFSKNAFQNSLTMYGPCCTFNTEDSYRSRNFTYRFVGSNLGLTVTLNTSNADDLVSLLNINGYIVIIHSPKNFPDISSVGSLQVFPMNNDESFLPIKAKLMDTSEELKSFVPSFRECYFDDEAPYKKNLLRINYTFANCITRCRIRSIITLCRCIPFYYTLESVENINVPHCTVSHLGCMQSYNFKWSNVLTKRINILGLEREVETALYCAECLPSCNDIQYGISMMSLPSDHFSLDNVGDNYNLSLEDLSVLRVYFDDPTAVYYRRVINNTWEEALSTVGNILSIFVGFSLVALFEILYFLLKYLYLIALKVFSQQNTTSNKHKKNNKQLKSTTKLYILP